MNKKLIVSVLLLSVLLSGCGGVSGAPAPAPTEAPAVRETPSPAPAEPEATPESVSPAEALRASLPPPPDIDINSWEYLYAGIDNGVGRYHPQVGVIEGQYLDYRVVEPAAAFLKAARDEGYQVWIGVGYRNFDYNLFYYENAILEYGNAYEAAKHMFPPGCSEHSTGLAFDITDEDLYAANYYNMHDETVADTPVCKWMCEHCSEYGFIVRYPEGREDAWKRSCYPGHFRYVGTEAAQYITQNGITFDEFLMLYK